MWVHKVDKMYHNGHFVFDGKGDSLSGFRSLDTGVLYGIDDLDWNDCLMATAERRADPLWSYAEDIAIEHDLEAEFHGWDDIECDEVRVDGERDGISDAMREAVIDICFEHYKRESA